MSSRQCAWVSKIPQGFKELLDAAVELKLFQVSENGPTQFVFKNDEDEKFRIQIGFIVSCSCSTLKINQQCVHTLFVLSKKFRVNHDNPIIWQGSFTDSEIEDIISLKYAPNRNQRARQNYLQARSGTKKIDNTLKNSKQQDRQPLDEESICPICQEDMKEDQALTYCRKKCGNNYHIKCLRIWIDHKLSSGDKISCPMCRTDMTNGIFDDIRKDEDDFNLRYVTHFGKTCNGCMKKNILGNLYHCLICDNIDLCHYCYESMQHPQHQKFLLKKKKDGEWEIAHQRIKKPSIYGNNSLKLDNQNILSVNHNNQFQIQSQYRNQNIIDLKPNQIFNNINDYLISCFQVFKDINSEQQISGLSIIGQEMNKNKNYCALCNTCDTYGLMRKLNCGHGIDTLCLKQLLQQQKYSCPTCSLPILKGYITALNLKIGDQNSQNNIKQTDNQQGLKKGLIQKVSGKQQNLKNVSSSTQNHDLTLTGNLLQPYNNSLNILGKTNNLEINGKELLQDNIDQSNENNTQNSLQNTKKSANFRIKKTTTTTTTIQSNKPPINKQPIKNDINNRIKEQKENLQQLIKQNDFQLIGKEIINSNDDNTIRGNTIGQYNKRNSIKIAAINNNQVNHSSLNNNKHIPQQYSNSLTDFNNENQDVSNQFQGQLQYNNKVTLSKNKYNTLTQLGVQNSLNDQISHSDYDNNNYELQDNKRDAENKQLNDEEEYNFVKQNDKQDDEEEEEIKENYNYYQNQNQDDQIKQTNEYQNIYNKDNTNNNQNEQNNLNEDELDEEELYQLQMIQEYERQFSGIPNQNHQEQLIQQEQEQIIQQEQNKQNENQQSFNHISNQNTTDFSSNNNIIQQTQNEFIDDRQSNISHTMIDNNEQIDNQFDSLSINNSNNNNVNSSNRININNIDQQSQKIRQNSKPKIQKISKIKQQQRIDSQINNSQSIIPPTFEIIGLSTQQQIRPTKSKISNNQFK